MKSHTPESLIALRQRLSEFLAAEGYRPSSNADGEVIFHFEGKVCYLQTTPEDCEYVRIVIVDFRPIVDEADRVRVTAAAQEVCCSTKVVKLFTAGGDTWCAAELFLPEPEQLSEILGRTLSAIRSALRAFDKSLARAM